MEASSLDELEFVRGIWLSEQPVERQKELLGKYLFEGKRTYLVVLIGPNKDEVMHTDILFGGNEESDWEHATKISRAKLPLHLNRVEYYSLSGKWVSTQHPKGYEGGPLKHSF